MLQRTRLRTKIVTLALLGGSLVMSGACQESRRRPCGEAYDHLVEIAKRRPDAKLRAEFVDACVDAFDPDRHACLLGATTTEDALACRPKRFTTE